MSFPKKICKNCIGSGIELGVYGRRICAFCSEEIIAGVMAMSDDEVSAELVAAGVDQDAEVARMRAIATDLCINHGTSNQARETGMQFVPGQSDANISAKSVH